MSGPIQDPLLSYEGFTALRSRELLRRAAVRPRSRGAVPPSRRKMSTTRWALKRLSPRRDHLGRIPMSSVSSARCAANVWITSSYSTSVICAASCRGIFNIITGPEHISHSTRIVLSLAAYSLPLQARSSRSRRWAVCIIATNVASHHPRSRPRLWRGGHPASAGPADQRSTDIAAITLAECYAERLIGSVRRECVDHVVVFGERHLRHLLLVYKNYLQRDAHAPVLEQGRTVTACRPGDRRQYQPSDLGRAPSTILPDMICGRDNRRETQTLRSMRHVMSILFRLRAERAIAAHYPRTSACLAGSSLLSLHPSLYERNEL